MIRGINEIKPVAVARVVHDARRRSAEQAFSIGGKRHFKLGDEVRSLTQVKNDGIYPHRDIGEVLVHRDDTGCVREDWSFLGEVYYTVEFVSRAVVVIMRGKEMERIASS
jgi:nitrogen fixation protein NifZ